MQTPGHILINLGILGRRDRPERSWPIIVGALLPDAALFGFYVWTRFIQGIPDGEIWDTLYFLPAWQTVFAVFNSIPLILLGLGVAYYYKQTLLAVCCGSALLHCFQDLPLHHDDGHRHFWPFTMFRFDSPISYWDPENNGVWGAGIEMILVLVACYFIFRRARSPWVKGISALMGGLYLFLYVGYLWVFANSGNS
ncbi:MAG: hypothetical protein AAGA75_18155 [Cyanobacteria bacterium P01_E01_bin.6]